VGDGVGTPPSNTFIWFNYGELELLKNACYRNYQVDWKMRLYSNDYTPAETDTGSGITEANFTGYTATTVGAWGTPTTVANVASSTAGMQTFTAGSSVSVSNTIYGWYLTHTGDSDTILGACRLVAPLLVNTALQVIQITPTITLRTLGS
jgi:hypothetical protein